MPIDYERHLGKSQFSSLILCGNWIDWHQSCPSIIKRASSSYGPIIIRTDDFFVSSATWKTGLPLGCFSIRAPGTLVTCSRHSRKVWWMNEWVYRRKQPCYVRERFLKALLVQGDLPIDGLKGFSDSRNQLEPRGAGWGWGGGKAGGFSQWLKGLGVWKPNSLPWVRHTLTPGLLTGSS